MIITTRKEKLDRLIDTLRDTDKSFRYEAAQLGLIPLSQEEKRYFDKALAICYECGCWFAADEIDDGICADCYLEEQEHFDDSEDEDEEDDY